MLCVLIALQVVRISSLGSRPCQSPLSLVPFPPLSPPPPLSPSPAHPFLSPIPRPFPSPPSPPEIISECQEWDVMIKQLKLAPTAHIFFMYLGFCEKHWSKAF